MGSLRHEARALYVVELEREPFNSVEAVMRDLAWTKSPRRETADDNLIGGISATVSLQMRSCT